MHYIGIDLGGTNIAAGIVDENLNIICKGSVPTNVPRPAQEIAADMAALVKDLLSQAGVSMDDVPWIGVGTPGTANRETGVVVYANNLHFNNVPLEKMLEDLTGKRCIIENDANAAAYGEYMAGSAKEYKSAVMITLGTGVGGGVIIDGKMLNGFDYAGGELGHTVIVYNGVPCTCGRKGCWEAYSSATGLIRMTRESMVQNKSSAMWELAGDLDHISGKTAFDAMRLGDSAGIEVVQQYIAYLACGLINVINTFRPDAVILGGGICREGHYLLDPLDEIVGREVYGRFSEKQTVLRTATLGNDAGIIGAAVLGKLENTSL